LAEPGPRTLRLFGSFRAPESDASSTDFPHCVPVISKNASFGSVPSDDAPARGDVAYVLVFETNAKLCAYRFPERANRVFRKEANRMTGMAMTQTPQATGSRLSGELYKVVELILDRGLVIDVFVRVSVIGLEVVTIDARVVVAGVDAYLRFAEMCGRLDLTGSSPRIGRSLSDGALPLELPGRARTEIGATQRKE
jgi:hypothetical protein